MIVEICVESFEDALIAEKAGCDRIELNSFLGAGGFTPYQGVLNLCLRELKVPVCVMLRNRGAGFAYRESEYKEMLNELYLLLDKDIEGVVFGFLNEDGEVDKLRTKEVVNLCHSKGKKAIFSRAFDNTLDPIEAIEALIDIGVDRLLTSGQKKSAIEGSNLIKVLCKEYGDKIDIVAGSGLTSFNVRDFIENSDVENIHASCRTSLIDKTTKTNVNFSYKTSPNGNAYDHIDELEVEKIVKAAK